MVNTGRSRMLTCWQRLLTKMIAHPVRSVRSPIRLDCFGWVDSSFVEEQLPGISPPWTRSLKFRDALIRDRGSSSFLIHADEA